MYKSSINGPAADPYHTVIDTEHPRSAHCDCPFAKDRHAICKQVAALCFTVFPSVADAFMREVEESEKRRSSANKSTTRDRTLRQKLEKRKTIQIALRRPR